MPANSAAAPVARATETHQILESGIELGVDAIDRDTVAVCFRMLTGVADDPLELTGIGSVVERTLSKGTRDHDGRGLADAFDALGVQWGTVSGRQSMLVRVLCLPEFVLDAVGLVAQMLRHPTFPEEACRVGVELAQQDLRSMEDEPYDLLRVLIQKLTLGPVLGRHPGGEPGTLARITREALVQRWRDFYHAGRLQVAAAGPVDTPALAARLNEAFSGFGAAELAGRKPAEFTFSPGRAHREKDLSQQYIAITLEGAARDADDFPVEQVLMGVLSGGMSGRLFTEVREKQGLVYWVGAWHEQPRGSGLIYLGASTTPERCDKTYRTLLRELERLSQDLTEEETHRARDSLVAHYQTEDDLTRARASGLSDDLFHFARPVGLEPKLAAIRAVTVERVEEYVRRLDRNRLCVATLGPKDLS